MRGIWDTWEYLGVYEDYNNHNIKCVINVTTS